MFRLQLLVWAGVLAALLTGAGGAAMADPRRTGSSYSSAVRLIIRIAMAVVANAIALLIAAAVLDGVTIDAAGFVFAVAIFSLASLLVRPVVAWIVLRRMRALLGVIALVTTFAILLVTDLLSDGIQIEGALDWVLATVIVWLATMVYDVFSRRLQRIALLRLGRPAT